MAKAATQPLADPAPGQDRGAGPHSFRETESRLDRYLDLLVEWQAKTDLVQRPPRFRPLDPPSRISPALSLAIGEDLGRSR